MPTSGSPPSARSCWPRGRRPSRDRIPRWSTCASRGPRAVAARRGPAARRRVRPRLPPGGAPGLRRLRLRGGRRRHLVVPGVQSVGAVRLRRGGHRPAHRPYHRRVAGAARRRGAGGRGRCGHGGRRVRPGPGAGRPSVRARTGQQGGALPAGARRGLSLGTGQMAGCPQRTHDHLELPAHALGIPSHLLGDVTAFGDESVVDGGILEHPSTCLSCRPPPYGGATEQSRRPSVRGCGFPRRRRSLRRRWSSPAGRS